MKSICFTGHRTLSGNIKTLSEDLENKLQRAILNGGITDFYAGGAYGWDMLAEKAVISLRDTQYPHIKLHLILPCRSDQQTNGWSSVNIILYNSVLELADSIEYTAYDYYNGCMKARNARLVAKADCCLCYLDPSKQSSGTAQTVRMALRKGITVYNFFNKY